jgi:alginate O-acetyltransferase complex protein AlgI
MLFNSYPFIFPPAVLLGYFATGRCGNRGPVIWLVLAFYAFSNWQFVSLLLASIACNYLIGLSLIVKKLRSRLGLAVLATGIGGDLSMLGIFKYAGFSAANFNALFRPLRR